MIKNFGKFGWLVFIVPMFWVPVGSTASIQYSVSDLGGGTWEYTYAVENDLGFDIDEFTIWFDYTLYKNLAVIASPADWDSIVIEPDTDIPDDGFFDSLFLVSGIVDGASLGGFLVSFDYLGAGTPGSQFFEIVDPDTFDVLDVGFTTVTAIPVPGAAWLLGSALGLFGWMRRKVA